MRKPLKHEVAILDRNFKPVKTVFFKSDAEASKAFRELVNRMFFSPRKGKRK